MESTTGRQPLGVKNSGIPRPAASSHLPIPTSSLLRKRAASEQLPDGKENAAKKVKLDGRHENHTDTSTIPAAKPPTRSSAAVSKPTAAKPPALTKKTSQVKGGTGKGTVGTGKATGAGKATAGAKTKAGGEGGGGKKKRPAWDLKGRLQDVEGLMADERKNAKSTIEGLQSRLESLAYRINDLEYVKQEQEGTIRVQQQEQSTASSQIQTLESELSATKQKLLETTHSYEHEVEMLKISKSALQRSHDDLEASLREARSEVVSLKATVSQMAADSSAIQCQLEATKVARDQAIAESLAKAAEIAHLQSEVDRHLGTIAECRERIQEDETIRRKLHNSIQELKGNIRVFCRVRPLLPTEVRTGDGLDDSTASNDSTSSGGSTSGGRKTSKRGSSSTSLQVDYPDRDNKKIALQFSGTESTSGRNYDFEFDQVFSPESTQQEVFGEISQLVQSALDGYNVCIFAYGQTGSGKTYTMEGPEGRVEEDRGMIPRAVQQVFQTASSLTEKGWEYQMEASFVEIYNETLRDLLATSTSNGDTKHEIKMDPNRPGEVYVTNLTPMQVSSEEQVTRLLERAARNRAVAATQCNERSSRSHSVFRLKLTGKNTKTGEACDGTLNLIDLAGSERLSQSGSVGDRLRETKNINKSLSNLGIVIMALANKEQHIPYRNSRLTYLLQNSLGGNSKTLMFVNISPHPTSFQETLCSLRFATKVNQCNIGTAKKVAK